MHDFRFAHLAHRALWSLGLAAATAMLAACGGGGSTAASPDPLAACTSLQSAPIAAELIALPTSGARTTSATLVASSGSGTATVGEYCKVQGEILPVDPAAPPIRFQVNLPTAWNQKALQMMGGGYDGTVVTGTGASVGAAAVPVPLARGYLTFGSDSGHQGSAAEASFALNEEALNNYLGDQLRKTRDVAVHLAQRRYGTPPRRTYAAGGSGGGREALYVADRWPQLYDGVIAFYPAWSLTAMLTNYTRIAKALAQPGAWPGPARQALVFNAVTAACDAGDGLADGLVSQPAACRFDAQTLRCPGGLDSGDACLSDAQIAGIGAMAVGLQLPFSLANGVDSYPGFSIYSGAADLRAALGSVAPATPSTLQMPFAHYIGESFARYFITRDASYDALRYEPNANGYFSQRAQYIASRQDIRPDFSAFTTRGGKLLILHGGADAIIPVASASELVRRMATAMGDTAMAQAVRYYEVPGYGHGNGAFTVSWDSLAALDAWVDQGQPPAGQTAVDMGATGGGRTRPLCDYPSWPRYSGTGDPARASSFTCVR